MEHIPNPLEFPIIDNKWNGLVARVKNHMKNYWDHDKRCEDTCCNKYHQDFNREDNLLYNTIGAFWKFEYNPDNLTTILCLTGRCGKCSVHYRGQNRKQSYGHNDGLTYTETRNQLLELVPNNLQFNDNGIIEVLKWLDTTFSDVEFAIFMDH